MSDNCTDAGLERGSALMIAGSRVSCFMVCFSKARLRRKPCAAGLFFMDDFDTVLPEAERFPFDSDGTTFLLLMGCERCLRALSSSSEDWISNIDKWESPCRDEGEEAEEGEGERCFLVEESMDGCTETCESDVLAEIVAEYEAAEGGSLLLSPVGVDWG